MVGPIALLLAWCSFFLAVAAEAEVIKPEDDHHQNIIPQSTAPHTSDISIPSNLTSMFSNGGVVAAFVASLSLLALLVVPGFWLKLCQLFGSCQDSTQYPTGYSANPIYGDYQGAYQQGTYNNPVYQKRSLEYVGPILKALGNAYEKYSRSVQSAKAE